MNKFARFLLLTAICVMALSYNPMPVFGDEDQFDAATCAISVTVDSIIEWDAANFAAIDLDLDSHITAQGTSPEGTSPLTLWMNCNVELSADNTAAAQLYHSRGDVTGKEDTLVTKYMITTDEAGLTASGAKVGAVAASSSSTLRTHDNFLTTPLVVTHFNTDGRVEVELTVEATNDSDNAADVGLYSAVQTITATWIEDN